MSRARVRYRVPFADTDGMGIVYHGNYVRYLELARIAWMDEHDRPYRDYVRDGFHFATTRVELDYLRPAAFDDVIEIETWVEWVRGASLAMGYELRRGEETVARASTEHAFVDGRGRPRRMGEAQRERLSRLALRSVPAERRGRGRGARRP